MVETRQIHLVAVKHVLRLPLWYDWIQTQIRISW